MLKYPIQFFNKVKYSKGVKAEHPLHKRMKSIICEYVSSKGLDYATEADMTHGRADIVVFWKQKVVIEVLHSETIAQFQKKKYDYVAIPIKTSLDEKNVKEILDDIDACQGDASYYRRTLK